MPNKRNIEKNYGLGRNLLSLFESTQTFQIQNPEGNAEFRRLTKKVASLCAQDAGDGSFFAGRSADDEMQIGIEPCLFAAGHQSHRVQSFEWQLFLFLVPHFFVFRPKQFF